MESYNMWWSNSFCQLLFMVIHQLRHKNVDPLPIRSSAVWERCSQPLEYVFKMLLDHHIFNNLFKSRPFFKVFLLAPLLSKSKVIFTRVTEWLIREGKCRCTNLTSFYYDMQTITVSEFWRDRSQMTSCLS